MANTPQTEAQATALAGERKLIEACQRGDREAFEALYQAHHRPVYLFLFSILRSKEQAEDTAQDVFVKLFTQVRSYRFQSSFLHWLFRLARNAAIDSLRRGKVRQAVSLDADSDKNHPIQERLAGNEPLASDSLVASERATRVRHEVEALPEAFREVLALGEWGEQSYEEIAQALGISEGTVKSRIFRARQMLSKKLKDLHEK